MYTKEQFSKLIDNTFLKQGATRDEVIEFCRTSKRLHFAACVVFPYWLPLASKELNGSDVKLCTVISFPHGASSRGTKVYEARSAVTNGADELDVVINGNALKSGDLDYVRREISDIVSSAQLSGMTEDAKRTSIKVIIDTPFLSDEEKVAACEIARDEGADFIATSTGTAPNGATIDDIRLMRGVLGPSIGVKASGGIRTIEHAMDLLDSGANRLGTSTGVALVEAYNPDDLLKAAR